MHAATYLLQTHLKSPKPIETHLPNPPLCSWSWVANAWNWVDAATYALQTAIAVMHLGRAYAPPALRAMVSLRVLAAVQYILLLLRVQYFSRSFKSMRFDLMDTLIVVMADVWVYLVVSAGIHVCWCAS